MRRKGKAQLAGRAGSSCNCNGRAVKHRVLERLLDALRVRKTELLSGSRVDDAGEEDGAAATSDPDRLRPSRQVKADGFGGFLVGLVTVLVWVRVLRRGRTRRRR